MDLNNNEYKHFIYWSIRKVNNLGMLLDAAKIIQEQGYDKIKFLIYGTGNEIEILQKCINEGIKNNV